MSAILALIDRTEDDARVAHAAQDVAEREDATVVLLHVAQPAVKRQPRADAGWVEPWEFQRGSKVVPNAICRTWQGRCGELA